MCAGSGVEGEAHIQDTKNVFHDNPFLGFLGLHLIGPKIFDKSF